MIVPRPVGAAVSLGRRGGRGGFAPHHAVANRTAPRSRRGFTLIELLVVIGVMILLFGGIGLAIAGRGGEGAALANAQSMLSSLVGSARAQAALHQTTARLIIYAQLPPTGKWDNYLRSLQVVRQETAANGSPIWVAAGDYVTLPAPICVVPAGQVPRDHLALPTGQNWNNNVATGPVTTILTQNGFSYRGQSGATANQFFGVQNQSGRIFYLEFAADGTVTSTLPGAPTKIVLATAILRFNAVPQFNNTSAVRGLFVRRSGAIALVDQSTAF